MSATKALKSQDDPSGDDEEDGLKPSTQAERKPRNNMKQRLIDKNDSSQAAMIDEEDEYQ
jgi:hypothetical protein